VVFEKLSIEKNKAGVDVGTAASHLFWRGRAAEANEVASMVPPKRQW
jgi:hypothetical protein